MSIQSPERPLHRPEHPHAPPPRSVMPALMSACVVVVVAMVAAINLSLPKLSGSDLHPSSTELLWNLSMGDCRGSSWIGWLAC